MLYRRISILLSFLATRTRLRRSWSYPTPRRKGSDDRRVQKTLASLHAWLHADGVVDALRSFRFVQKTKGGITSIGIASRVLNKLHVVCGPTYDNALCSRGWNVTPIPLSILTFR
ncbi:hypothetical protein C8Q74DRAFT_413392 [Fomes fomentarius]|nr:hypothetical protein C8Q74DRAFT_413392 [Fomes fomentarius]